MADSWRCSQEYNPAPLPGFVSGSCFTLAKAACKAAKASKHTLLVKKNGDGPRYVSSSCFTPAKADCKAAKASKHTLLVKKH